LIQISAFAAEPGVYNLSTRPAQPPGNLGGSGGSVFGSSRKLLATCIAARQDGKDFPTIWRDILKGRV
jgi:hypothetical protein